MPSPIITTETGTAITTETGVPLTIEYLGPLIGPTAAFFAAEATLYAPFDDPVGPADLGLLAMPGLALCQVEVTPSRTTQIFASDMGYRTADTDPQGVVPYPPTVEEAFAVSVSANLDPTKSAVAAAWGTMTLANFDHRYDQFVYDWSTDGQPIRVLRGSKLIENYLGQQCGRTTANATYFDTNGVMVTAPANTFRYDNAAGFAGARANYTPNGNATGTAAGSPGTTPAGWQSAATAGLTRTVFANGVSAGGVNYCEQSWVGTTSATGGTIRFQQTSSIPSYQGDQWTGSVNLNLTGGDFTNCTPQVRIWGISATGTQSEIFNQAVTVTGAGLDSQRFTITATLANVNTRFVMFSFELNLSSGVAINFQVQIGNAQLERGSSATAYIPTTGHPIAVITAPPVLLNEPAATNVHPTSETLSNFNQVSSANQNWINASQIINPKGGTTTWKLAAAVAGTAVNAIHYDTVGGPAGGMATRSLFVQETGVTTVTIGDWGGSSLGTGFPSATFDLRNGIVSGVTPGATATMTRYPFSWWRITFTAPMAANAASISIRLAAADVPDTSRGVLCFGVQMEQGSVATSYIQTPSTTAVTRSADDIFGARGIMLDPPYGSLVQVFQGVMGPWRINALNVEIALRDASYYLERPVPRSLYGGTGLYDGDTGLAGLQKPIAIGYNTTANLKNVTPVVMDAANLIYQIHDGQAAIYAVYDGGAPLTFSSDVPNLYSGTTTAGHYRTNVARGLFQLGGVPTFQVTADIAEQYTVSGSTDLMSQLCYRILANLMQVPVNLIGSSDGLNIDGLGADPVFLAEALAMEVALYIASDDSPDGVTLISRLLEPTGGVLVPCRDGKLRVYVPTAIPVGATPVQAFDDTNIIDIQVQNLPATVDPPPWRIRVACDRNWTVMQTGIAGSVSSTKRAWLNAAYRTAIAQDPPSELLTISRPNDMPVIGPDAGAFGLATSTAVKQIAAGILALWGSQHRLYTVTVPMTVGETLDWGSIVSLTTDFDILQTGPLGQIAGWAYKTDQATQDFTVLV